MCQVFLLSPLLSLRQPASLQRHRIMEDGTPSPPPPPQKKRGGPHFFLGWGILNILIHLSPIWDTQIVHISPMTRILSHWQCTMAGLRQANDLFLTKLDNKSSGGNSYVVSSKHIHKVSNQFMEAIVINLL